MKEIKLTQGKVALVDDEDFEYLNRFKWYADTNRMHTSYAARKIIKNGKKTSIRMHTFILNIPEGMLCDHIDHDGLNNQRSNIRICSPAENYRNKSPYGRSRFLGVSYFNRKKPWRAFIKIGYKSISLGYYSNEEDAAFAYNKAARKYFKEFANLNLLEPSM